jgi:hypothetical protein
MNGNLCPCCGKPVMNYWRFVTEAEPTKQTTCSNCGGALKRSPTVWLLVVTMLILMLATSYPLFTSLYKNGYAVLTLIFTAVVWLSMWVMLVNFLSWQLIKWKPADAADSP